MKRIKLVHSGMYGKTLLVIPLLYGVLSELFFGENINNVAGADMGVILFYSLVAAVLSFRYFRCPGCDKINFASIVMKKTKCFKCKADIKIMSEGAN